MRFLHDEERLHGDEGAVLVEFALLLPLLMFMFLGVLDFGMAFKDRNVLEGAIQQSLRTNTNRGTNRWAEGDALLAFQAAMSKNKRLQITNVIIWKSAAGNTTPTCSPVVPVPGALGPYGTAGTCNAYSRTQMATLTAANEASYFDAANAASCSGSSWDVNWCPTSRSDTQISASYIGMQVTVDYRAFTSIFGSGTRSIVDRAVMRVEPA
jgi:hypothetical protein